MKNLTKVSEIDLSLFIVVGRCSISKTMDSDIYSNVITKTAIVTFGCLMQQRKLGKH